MTDKSKPWLNADHVEAIIACASRDRLTAWLETQGIKTEGTGIGVTDDNQHACIHVFMPSKEAGAAIPKRWETHEVKVIVVGQIVAG